MVAEDTTVYLAVSGVLGLVWLVLAGYALRSATRSKQIAFVATVPALAMAGAYLLMHLEILTYETAGREQSLTRFFGYTLAILALTYILRETVYLPNTQTSVLGFALLATLWTQLISWFLTGVLESAVTALGLGFFVYTVYLLYRPLEQYALETGGKRRLLYAKLRNLWIICYATLVVTSVMSEQVLGVLTPFVSSVTAGFIDLVLMAGVGFLTIAAISIFESDTTPAVDSEPSG